MGMMTTSNAAPPTPATCTAFDGVRQLAGGSLAQVATAVAQRVRAGPPGPVLVFDDETGAVIDLDTRGTDAEIFARLGLPPSPAGASAGEAPSAPAPRGRGRPKLGVVAREVTLLPRHWDWLASQSGGASVALRKLVEQARRASSHDDRRRRSKERAYRFMAALAGNLPGFEEATRALFADDRGRFDELTAAWPPDLRAHAVHLAFDSDAAAVATPR
jgi:hypothetical protein